MHRIVKLLSIALFYNGIVFHLIFDNSFQFTECSLKRDVNITSFTTSISLKICHSVNIYLKHVPCFWTTSHYIVFHLACEHWYENVSKFDSNELVQTIQNIHPVSFLEVNFQYTCSLNVAFYGFLFRTFHWCNLVYLFLSSFCLPIKKWNNLLWKFLTL